MIFLDSVLNNIISCDKYNMCIEIKRKEKNRYNCNLLSLCSGIPENRETRNLDTISTSLQNLGGEIK